jgi:DNA ligase-1
VKPVVTKPKASSSKPQVEKEDKKPENATKSKTNKPVASIFAKPVAKKEEKVEEEYRESPDHDQEEGEEELDDEEEEEQEGKAAVKL